MLRRDFPATPSSRCRPKLSPVTLTTTGHIIAWAFPTSVKDTQRLRKKRVRCRGCLLERSQRDEVVPLVASQSAVEALKAAGGQVRFTIYPEAGHDSWTETYSNPELYAWFLSHSR